MPTPIESTAAGPVEAFWRFRTRTIPVCIALGVLGAAFAFLTGGDTKVTTAMYLTDPRGVPVFRDGTTAATDMQTYLNQRARFAVSDSVFDQVIKSIDEPEVDLEYLRATVRSMVEDNSSFVIECDDADSDRAFLICGEVTESYIELTRADTQRRADIAIGSLQQTKSELLAEIPAGQTTGSIQNIEVDIADTAKQAALFDAGVEFVDAPRAVDQSRLVPTVQYGIAAFMFGVLVTGVLAWLAALRRPIVSSPEGAAASLGAPLVGMIEEHASSAGVEVVATNLANGGTGILVVSGSTDASNHSDLVAGLAEAWTREGRRVLVVDGNLRKPRLSARFGAGLSSVGLTDLLGGLATESAAIRSVKLPDGPAMSFISCGQTVDHAASLLRSANARQVLTNLQERYDVVLVDAPPMMDRAEGSALASVADGVLLVVPSGTPSNDLTALRRRMDVLRAPLLGVVYDVADR
ncbi:MAG: CpsD/CapB family tyrosine-protein kinase [Acidimicrobiales bacterium]|nr:CpsD/CapB family tyrosine-protein kinase [Acidimicrobiales bacterium]MCB9392612.1 CpsD/CapB family tyrosine-protein kinase [Acidimicrobiaceae bacterium]